MVEKKVPVKAGIHTLNTYSAHADQQMLMVWIKSMSVPLREIRLVHGEERSRQVMASVLNKSMLSEAK
jgi:metallo-beta-lactamase family protein